MWGAGAKCDFACGMILEVHTFLFKLMKRNVVRERNTHCTPQSG